MSGLESTVAAAMHATWCPKPECTTPTVSEHYRAKPITAAVLAWLAALLDDPATIAAVAKALRDHNDPLGQVAAPSDEYDCCAPVVVAAIRGIAEGVR